MALVSGIGDPGGRCCTGQAGVAGSGPLHLEDLQWQVLVEVGVGTFHLELGAAGGLLPGPSEGGTDGPTRARQAAAPGTSGLGGHLGQLWGPASVLSSNAGHRLVRRGQLDSILGTILDKVSLSGLVALYLVSGQLLWVAVARRCGQWDFSLSPAPLLHTPRLCSAQRCSRYQPNAWSRRA